MDFVFMLTSADRTVANALDVLDQVKDLGLGHVGFKDVGLDRATLVDLLHAIKQMGATSYLEVVSEDPAACVASARLAREVGIDRLLGGTLVDEVLAITAGSGIEYLPFPGRPFGHPTRLGGTVADIEADCRRFAARGAAGVDLLAYRATEADPIELVRAARRATPGLLLVAGGVASAAQVRALKGAGADAFTVGSAAFDETFAPGAGPLRSQLEAVLDACR